MPEDYCELCELPFSTCVHGRPPPPEPPATPRASPVRTSRAKAPARVPGASAPTRAPSRVTPPEAFRGHILAVLAEAGGHLDTESVMQQLAERMDDVLLERDRQVAPGGEVRWQTSARKERKAMIDEGLVVGAQPGTWELTDLGSGLA